MANKECKIEEFYRVQCYLRNSGTKRTSAWQDVSCKFDTLAEARGFAKRPWLTGKGMKVRIEHTRVLKSWPITAVIK